MKLCTCVPSVQIPSCFIQFAISTLVTPWDNPTVPPGVTYVDNIEMGKALLGVITNPNARGVTLNVVPETLKKLAENGTL